MRNIFKFIALMSILVAASVHGAGFVGGIPTSIMKSDYSTIHVLYVGLESPVPKGACTSGAGLVIEDSNESSQAALTMALTALASGKKFQCYVTDQCSPITGAVDTFPVCKYYPSILK